MRDVSSSGSSGSLQQATTPSIAETRTSLRQVRECETKSPLLSEYVSIYSVVSEMATLRG